MSDLHSHLVGLLVGWFGWFGWFGLVGWFDTSVGSPYSAHAQRAQLDTKDELEQQLISLVRCGWFCKSKKTVSGWRAHSSKWMESKREKEAITWCIEFACQCAAANVWYTEARFRCGCAFCVTSSCAFWLMYDDVTPSSQISRDDGRRTFEPMMMMIMARHTDQAEQSFVQPVSEVVGGADMGIFLQLRHERRP